MNQLLGKGGNANVYLVARDTKEYAVKVIKKDLYGIKESYITSTVQRARGVVKLHEVEEDRDNMYLYLEKYDHLDIKKFNPAVYTKHVLEILASVHDIGIIHNDVKFENFMLGDCIRLIDFGNSRFFYEKDKYLTKTTPLYTSIDALQHNITAKTDVWAVGVMAFYMLTDVFPFDGAGMYSTFRQILECEPDFLLIDDIVARDFVIRLLDKKMDRRPSAEDALQHEWLKSI